MGSRAATGEGEEWLVTDRRGGFAMGTTAGFRTRKYHGFYLTIAGRSECAYLADLELKVGGRDLWPHRYGSDRSDQGAVVHPRPTEPERTFGFAPQKGLPRWRWTMPEGELLFGVESDPRGGIRLSWNWKAGERKSPLQLEVRPFWAMRPLHAIGGSVWRLELDSGLGTGAEHRRRIAKVVAGAQGPLAYCAIEGRFEWREDPQWYHRFAYSEEQARGYPAQEDLYSAGRFVLDLTGRARAKASWHLSESLASIRDDPRAQERGRAPALDFVLHEPAGVVAGFPWFGEWGRDTFIALPGIAAAWIRAGGDATQTWGWARAVLARWGEWIRLHGMIPNLIDKRGTPQWESADGTLWWCHALASLWALGRDAAFPFGEVESVFRETLSVAIDAIESGRHSHLTLASDGLLEVTSPQSTWMDAQVDGAPVTPRVGRLPEINALWFQARCLQWLWRGPGRSSAEALGLERLARAALGCREPHRPNGIFLHSIPLAPSFVLRDDEALASQLREIAKRFWTPVGLRTLSPIHPSCRSRCQGDQRARDLAYHQGPPWAWLGGHYLMARDRWIRRSEIPDLEVRKNDLLQGPVQGHVPELFDAEPPFAPRGAPAQAWSDACFEEAAARRSVSIDAKLTGVLAQRWLDHLGERDTLLRRDTP